MAKDQADFTKGRMNKSVDERLLPAGEYIDAQNVRLGSTELSEVGAVENTKGNVRLTELKYSNVALSNDAVCIGALEDGAEETMYWFVHDPANPVTGGVVDMIVSFNTQTQQLTYHVVTTALLNFNPTYLITGVDLIDDLLFFTDDYNPPRKINVTRGYPPPTVLHVDQIAEIDISVIKPQPKTAPTIELQYSANNGNHIEDAFISFAYRYRYKDGEYSATSQFSEIAFDPTEFYVKDSTILNGGMINEFNLVKVSYNTGPSNVTGIEVVYKKSDSNAIYVARKIDKSNPSFIPNNIQQSINFDNSEIYTIINQSELLRLYDNVPRLAKAQSIAGGRLMYGNYLEGRDLVDQNGNKTQITYNIERVSRRGSIAAEYYDAADATPYQYELTGSPVIINNASLLLDVAGRPPEFYRRDVTLTITVKFKSEGVNWPANSGWEAAYPTQIGQERTVLFQYSPLQDCQTAFQAYDTNLFKDKTGENGFEPNPQLWVQDSTLTGVFNYNTPEVISLAPQTFPNLVPIRSGRISVSPVNEPILFEVQPDGNILITPNAIEYDTGTIFNGNAWYRYQFFSISEATVSWRRRSGEKSLHSNRDYQVGIVYQDYEGRQTTAFESSDNAVHVSSVYSDSINSIKVNIPITMRPPVWADRYKFVMSQSKTDYDTIFCTRAYVDDKTGRYWVFLDGEQSNKLTAGQELVVKKDSTGALSETVTTTVLDVVSQASDFLSTNIPVIEAIAGLYASVDPDGWSIDSQQNSVLTNSQRQSGPFIAGGVPIDLYYPVHDTTTYLNWAIPAGSLINININFIRRGSDESCGDKICRLNEQYIAAQDYPDFYQFWFVQGVSMSDFDCSETNDPLGANPNVFNPNMGLFTTIATNAGESHVGENQLQFFEDATNQNALYLRLSHGSAGCPPIEAATTCRIEVITQEGLLVFETKPTGTSTDVYFENEQSFPIINGFHTSGTVEDDQDQTALQQGIVNLSFFNCFTFLNGVESYKIKDSITGRKFYLGQRVTAASEQDYKEVRRGASITYSGVYNEQTNINRTNEFNLGLSNYKDCEASYGPIQVLHARNTDLLTLQEDKISYILLGKNLLQAADGAGVLTSVPIVLGTQLARVEEYGISQNPESFAHYGSDIYFTDAKRSSVIQLKGGSSGESLSVISISGMRSWFRDLFQTSFNYQKLGGYDPYMNEYVLSPNTNLLPFEDVVYGCGGLSRVFTGLLVPTQFTVDAGLLYGNVTVFIEATHEVSVTVTYNGTTTPPVLGVGSLNLYFDKDIPSVTTFEVTITPTDLDSESSTEVFVGCPIADTVSIIPIVITSAADQGALIHNLYGYFNGAVSPTYQSPLQSEQIQFITPSQQQYVSPNLVQFRSTYTAQQGSGSVPIDGSLVQIISSKPFGDTFDFDPIKNSFRYLRTPIVYQNTASDVATLLSLSTTTPNLGSTPLFYGNFTMPAGNDGDYLYLIWDYRDVTELKLCFSSTPSISEACCECFSSPNCVPFLGTTVEVSDTAACALSPTTTYYTSTITVLGIANTEPVLGTTVYSYLGCSSGNTMGAGVIKLTDNTWVELDANGVVILTGSC